MFCVTDKIDVTERGNFQNDDVIQIQAAQARNFGTTPAEIGYLVCVPEIPRARFHWVEGVGKLLKVSELHTVFNQC
jgi:hypothetical protein